MKTILIVDQEKNITFTLQKLLESESFNVLSSHNLQEVISILNTQKFDLVVVSRDMPGSGEFDLVQWLMEYSPHTHIITLSSAASIEGKSQKVLADFTKPLDFYSLVKTIKTSLAVKGFSGILSDISLQDYIQMFCMNGSTKAILVTQKNEKGIILIRDGNVEYAIQDQLEGEEAFFRIMSWKKGTLKEVKIKKFPEANIHKDFNFLLIEGASRSNSLQLVEPHGEQGQDAQGALLSEKTSVNVNTPGQKNFESAEDKPGVVSGRSIGPGKDKINSRLSVIPRRRPWLKIAVAAILPLLVLIIGINGFFLFSAQTDVSVLQNNNGQAGEKQSSHGLEPAVVELKEEVMTTKPAENASVLPRPGDTGTQKGIVITPLPVAVMAEELAETVILRLHGSNTIGAQFAPALAQSFMKDILKAPKVEIVAGNANEVKVRAVFADRIETIEIQAHGSTTGFEGLAQKKCDIAMSSRKIKEVEIEQLKALGDMTAITNEHVIALDGIAVIVNKSNPLQKLDVHKLADIFTGKITDWSAVQETKGPITIYARDEKSGTFDTFKHIVLGKTELKANILRFESNPELSDKVAMDPAGIGFTSLPNIRKAKGLAIAEEGAGAIFPNFFTIATEDYPLSRRLYFYTEANPSQPLIRDFVEYTHSRAGQTIAKDLGFVDLNIKSFVAGAIDAAVIKNAGLIQQYAASTKDAERLSLNFRFKNNLSVLDNRAMRDLDRIVEYLQETLGKKIILSGFADNSGDYEHNRILALERAETVAQELRSRGIPISTVISAGEELPVASNATDLGREKNRRVEVWIK